MNIDHVRHNSEVNSPQPHHGHHGQNPEVSGNEPEATPEASPVDLTPGNLPEASPVELPGGDLPRVPSPDIGTDISTSPSLPEPGPGTYNNGIGQGEFGREDFISRDRAIDTECPHEASSVKAPEDDDRAEKIADIKNEIADLKDDLARSLDAAQNPKKINAHNQQLASDWRSEARDLRTEADDLLKDGFGDSSSRPQVDEQNGGRYYN